MFCRARASPRPLPLVRAMSCHRVLSIFPRNRCFPRRPARHPWKVAASFALPISVAHLVGLDYQQCSTLYRSGGKFSGPEESWRCSAVWERIRNETDATGIRQTHRTKSIHCSSVVGLPPPLGKCGLVARHHRRDQAPVTEPSPGDAARVASAAA
jgi:hypothetical protein